MSASQPRLHLSPTVVLARALDGRPFVARETEPYDQFWLSDREQRLLSLFGSRRGATVRQAIDGCLRLDGVRPSADTRRSLERTVASMRGAGLLVEGRDDTSRYDADIVRAYLRHRPFPAAIAAHLVQRAHVGPRTRVLDVAGGPGDLALTLARTSDAVTLLDLSRGFLRAASRRAARAGLRLRTLHESANRLPQHEETYDVVTIAQALHWLDDVQVCRGVSRLLRPDGSVFVLHAAVEVSDTHPLADIFGYDSRFGVKPRRPFPTEVPPLLRRLSRLFEAFDTAGVEHVDPTHRGPTVGSGLAPIVPVEVTILRQPRPIGLGYARAFLTDRHITGIGEDPVAFWRGIEERCRTTTSDLLGVQHWAVLHFARRDTPTGDDVESAVQEIGYDGPVDDAWDEGGRRRPRRH